MAQYPTTKLDRAVDSAIARENAAVIEEEREARRKEATRRKWQRNESRWNRLYNRPIREKATDGPQRPAVQARS